MNTCLYTNRGGRENNEDYALYAADGSSGVWVLADGLGGHERGEVAAKLAAEYIVSAAGKERDYTEPTLLKIADGANALIRREQQRDGKNRSMRTTVVAAFSDGEKISYFNVGDSRFYYFKNGCLYRQSKDHSVSRSPSISARSQRCRSVFMTTGTSF